MTTHVLSLNTYPDTLAAFAAHDRLVAEFKRIHKRGERVDLVIRSSSITELCARYTLENEPDARWFQSAAQEGNV